MNKQFCIYIMTNFHNTVLYTGVTGNLLERVVQHREELLGGFTKKYHLNKLVYYEMTDNVHAALWREKQIKSWTRQKKLDLIRSVNPEWQDLFIQLTTMLGEEEEIRLPSDPGGVQ